MPVQSEAQRRLMYAALKDPKGTGIPRSVAEKFVGPKAHEESEMKKPMPAFLMKGKKDEKKAPAKKMMGGGMAYNKGGSIDGCATKGKTKGKMVKMAMGGKTC
jgi:hypothetical protein